MLALGACLELAPSPGRKNKVSLQTSLERNFLNFSYLFFGVNFENLTVEFHIPHVLNMYIKFRSNWILFIIQLINLFLYTILDHKNLKL